MRAQAQRNQEALQKDMRLVRQAIRLNQEEQTEQVQSQISAMAQSIGNTVLARISQDRDCPRDVHDTLASAFSEPRAFLPARYPSDISLDRSRTAGTGNSSRSSNHERQSNLSRRADCEKRRTQEYTNVEKAIALAAAGTIGWGAGHLWRNYNDRKHDRSSRYESSDEGYDSGSGLSDSSRKSVRSRSRRGRGSSLSRRYSRSRSRRRC